MPASLSGGDLYGKYLLCPEGFKWKFDPFFLKKAREMDLQQKNSQVKQMVMELKNGLGGLLTGTCFY